MICLNFFIIFYINMTKILIIKHGFQNIRKLPIFKLVQMHLKIAQRF